MVAARGCPAVAQATKVVRGAAAAAACPPRLIKTSTTTEATTPVEDPLWTTNMGEAIIAQVEEATQTSTAATTIGATPGDPLGATTRRTHQG